MTVLYMELHLPYVINHSEENIFYRIFHRVLRSVVPRLIHITLETDVSPDFYSMLNAKQNVNIAYFGSQYTF